MIKLFATDMDGTFLKADKTYDTERFAQLHQQMLDRNIQFVVASGNQYFQLRSFFEAYPDVIFVAENGAYIRDTEHIYNVESFDDTTVNEMLTELHDIPDIQILACGQESAYTLNTTDPAHVEEARHYYHHLAVIDDYAQMDDNILKFAITCPVPQTQALIKDFTDRFAGRAVPTSSGHGDIDLIQPGINKAYGLTHLGQRLGISLDDMAAFGDGGNDIEMLQAVGTGVAMANAQPDVLAVANHVTGNNEDQGVLQFIANELARR